MAGPWRAPSTPAPCPTRNHLPCGSSGACREPVVLLLVGGVLVSFGGPAGLVCFVLGVYYAERQGRANRSRKIVGPLTP